MSAEARILSQVEDAVREATEPLRKAVEALSARLGALEGSGGAKDTETSKRPATGRTARAKAAPVAEPAEATATAGDPFTARESK